MKVRNFKKILFSVLFIAACGGGGGGGGSSTPSTPSPIVTLSSSSASVIVGEVVTLSWSSTNATSCSASGAWTGSKAVNGNEDVTISTSGANNFSLSCTGEGGSGSSSASVSGIANISGVVVDGYIRDASVFLDTNADFILDADETTTTSDANGSFTLPNLDTNVVAINGVDADSNNTLTNFSLVQAANTSLDFRAITPLTSIAFHLTDPTTINTILGLDSSIDINTADPVANINESNSYKFLYEKGNQVTLLVYSMQSAINDIAGTQDTSEAYFSSIASTLTSQYDASSEAVNIESSSFIDGYVDLVMENITATISDSDKQNLKNTLKSIMPVVSVRNDLTVTKAITNFITGTFINDFISMAKGEAAESLVNNYVSSINSLIAADQGIDSNDLVQQITLVDDTSSVNEDENVTFTILNNDTIEAGLDYFGLFIELSTATSGIATLNSDQTVTYEPDLNFNGQEDLVYTVNVDGTVASGNIAITINPVNDAPTFDDLASNFTIEENTTSVTTVAVTDVEEDAIGFSLSGEDKDLFSISGTGVIAFVSNPDFESPADSNQDNIYNLNIEASDGTDSVIQAVTVEVSNIENEGNPIITGLASSLTVDENQQSVIEFTVSDPQNDTITYSISGVDKDLFALIFDGSAASLTMNAVDYENPTDSDANNIYSVSVNFSDDLNTTTQAIELLINNVNDNNPAFDPDFATAVSINENQNNVTTIQASDADGDDLTYSISGGDSSVFAISSSGVITMTTNPDFESKSSYVFNCSISDGVNEAAAGMTVTILNVNEAPVFTSYTPGVQAQISAEENTTSLTTIAASDEDGDTLSFSISGSDASAFTISDAGTLSLSNSLDFENPSDTNTDNIYDFSVTVSDSALSASVNFSLSIQNTNDNAPVISDLALNTDVSNGQTSVTSVTVTDADNDTPTLSLTGDDAAALNITSEGVITFNTNPDYTSPIDSDGDNIYEFTVNASDADFTTTQSATVTVLETNDPPTFNGLESSYSVEENTVEVVSVSASDPDGSPITFSLSGDDSGDFTISASGVLSFAATSDYEIPSDDDTNNIYEINVVISDGSNEVSQAVSITVTEVPEAPEFIGLPAVFLIEENDNTVLTLEVADPEGDDFGEVTMSGVDAAEFLLGSNGFLRFNSLEGANYEVPTDANQDNIYEITFSVTDTTNNLTRVQDLSVQVTDLKDTFSLTQTIFVASTTVLDGDVPTPMNNGVGYPEVPNNSLETSQTLITPSEVTGFVGDKLVEVIVRDEDGNVIFDDEGEVSYNSVQRDDPEDWYKIDTVPGLQIELAVEDYQQEIEDADGNTSTVTNKPTLLLYNSAGGLVNVSYTADSTDEYQKINLPDSGIYYAVVAKDVGAAKYTLLLSPGSSASSTSFESSNGTYVEGEFISYIPFKGNLDNYKDDYPKFNQDESLNQKISYIDKSNFMGLRVIEFDVESEYFKVFGNDTLLDNEELKKTNPEQIFYLKQWNLLQHYKKLNPKLNLEFNRIHEKLGFTQDTYWDYQWGLKLMGLDKVLNATGQDAKDVAVAVIDSGSPSESSTAWTTSHFLQGGFDFIENDSDPFDSADVSSNSHGTHVATTISAANDGNNINGFGIYTVPFRVFGPTGGASQSDVTNSMLYAAGLPNITGQIYSGSVPIRVVNMSLGSIGGGCSTAYRNAIADVTNAGVTVVSSSGNSAEENPGVKGYPASCENVISVGAVDPLSQRAYYSTYNDELDVAAPGGTTGTDLNGDGQSDGILAFDGSENLAYYQGTSMASPHAAGAIALIYALKPEWDAVQMEAFIKSGFFTDDIGTEGKDDEFGYGLINLDKAFTNLIDGGLDFTYATITPGSFNFGYTDTEKLITITKVGTGDLSVTQVTSPNSELVSIEAIEIDASGFGTYKITLIRGDVPDGTYNGSVVAELSDDSKSNVTFTYSLGAERVGPEIGYVLAYLYDDNGDYYKGWRIQLGEGGLTFQVTDIDIGTYKWLFSTNIDSDGYIRGYGEIWENYPELTSQYEFFTLTDSDIEASSVYLKTRSSGGALSASSMLSDLNNKNETKHTNIKSKLIILEN